MAFLIVKVRAGLPRYRYDQLMYLCWYIFLPISLSILILYFGICLKFEIYSYSVNELFLEVSEKNKIYYAKSFGY
jgi:hypothetical protein